MSVKHTHSDTLSLSHRTPTRTEDTTNGDPGRLDVGGLWAANSDRPVDSGVGGRARPSLRLHPVHVADKCCPDRCGSRSLCITRQPHTLRAADGEAK